MVVLGLMMASLGRSYYQLLLSQGFCIGIGAGCIFIVSVAIIPQYFSTKRAFAIGIAASGSSLGGVIYPIVFHELQPVVGYGWATRIMGFIALATLSIPCACIRLRVLPLPRKSLIDFSGFKEPPFALFCLASFVGFIGLYVPFFFYHGVRLRRRPFYEARLLHASRCLQRQYRWSHSPSLHRGYRGSTQRPQHLYRRGWHPWFLLDTHTLYRGRPHYVVTAIRRVFGRIRVAAAIDCGQYYG